MPNIKSAKKRLRQNEGRSLSNQAVRSKVRSKRKLFFQTMEGSDEAARQEAYKTYCSVLDKAVKTGRIKKNTAVRRKARAANRLRALS